MASEEWRPVVGYEGKYEVSDRGRVRNTRTLRVLTLLREYDSWIVLLYSPRKKTTLRLVVADAFIPFSPDHVRIVEHLNGNPLDCCSRNLQWTMKTKDEFGEVWMTTHVSGQYLVSSHGRVKHKGNMQIIKAFLHLGYLFVSFRFTRVSGITTNKNFSIHRLVAEVFLKRRDSFHNEVRHLNGIKTDNRVENLMWGTRAENMDDGLRLRERSIGSHRSASKLKESEVVIIRRLVKQCVSTHRVAALFQINQSNVSRINRHKGWRHVP